MSGVTDGDTVEFSQLSRELRLAIGQDRRHALENEAKFRAVEQRVATYDQFRDMVNAAHLRPLDRKDSLHCQRASGAGSSLWNSLAASKRRGVPTAADCPAAPPPAAEDRLPTSLQELLRRWRPADVAGRLQLLRRMGAGALGHVLRADVPAGLLGELLHTLLAFPPDTEHTQLVVRVLQAVSETRRFSLCLQFLSIQERNTCEQLIEKLLSCLEGRQQDLADVGVTEWTIQELKNKYEL